MREVWCLEARSGSPRPGLLTAAAAVRAQFMQRVVAAWFMTLSWWYRAVCPLQLQRV